MQLNEIRKEEDMYYIGAFWIVGDSLSDIYHNKFKIIGPLIAVDYNGTKLGQDIKSRKEYTHKHIWDNLYGNSYPEKAFNYFPRGRVGIYNGEAFINIAEACNRPKIINNILDIYNLRKLSYIVDVEDDDTDSHYAFQLK